MALLLIALIGSWLVPKPAFAAAPGYSEDEVEAAFLYRFAGFVSWPKPALDSSAFTVAILDDDAVASALGRMLPRHELKGRQVRVRRITSIDQIGNAQILYIGQSDARTLKRWMGLIAGRPVLVVTNQPGGLDAGSVINFLVVDRHVRFEISLAAAQRSGLNISADLLSVAMHVQGRPIGSETPCEIAPPQFRARSSCSPRLASR